MATAKPLSISKVTAGLDYRWAPDLMKRAPLTVRYIYVSPKGSQPYRKPVAK